MSEEKRSPFRPVDDEARDLAKTLIEGATFGALGVLKDGAPFVSRIALAKTDIGLLTLVSELSTHTEALMNTPEASLLVGEPGKGDPLAHPRITLTVTPEIIDKATHGEAYLTKQPKAALYIGFGDFRLIRLNAKSAFLNGGFGKAYNMTEKDL